MSIIYVLIPIGLILVAIAVGAFFWATRTGQYDDLESPAWRILLDDDSRPPPRKPEHDDTDGRPDDR